MVAFLCFCPPTEYLALLRIQTTERLSMPGSPFHTGLYTPTAPPIQLSTISSVVSIWHLFTTSEVPPQFWFWRPTAIFSVFLLYTPDGNYPHVSRELCELIWACQVRNTYTVDQWFPTFFSGDPYFNIQFPPPPKNNNNNHTHTHIYRHITSLNTQKILVGWLQHNMLTSMTY